MTRQDKEIPFSMKYIAYIFDIVCVLQVTINLFTTRNRNREKGIDKDEEGKYEKGLITITLYFALTLVLQGQLPHINTKTLPDFNLPILRLFPKLLLICLNRERTFSVRGNAKCVALRGPVIKDRGMGDDLDY